MIFKVIAGVISSVLLIAYMAPVVWRLQEAALWVIVLLGVGMMLVDLWQALTSKED